jgi:hypothetical protein
MGRCLSWLNNISGTGTLRFITIGDADIFLRRRFVAIHLQFLALFSQRSDPGKPMPLIETPRLIIRDVQASDVDAFFGYMQHESYWRDVPIERPSVQSITALVNASLLDQAKQPRTGYFLAAVEKRSRNVIGEAILQVRSLHRRRQGEIGWASARPTPGKVLRLKLA